MLSAPSPDNNAASDPLALRLGMHRNQKQFGLFKNITGNGKAYYLILLAGEEQAGAGQA